MRVLIATGIFSPDIGGPATYSKKMAEELMAGGNTVKVLTYSDNKFSVLDCQFPVIRVSRKLPVFFRYLVYFLAVLWHGRDVDLIYLQDPVSSGLPTALANLFLRKRLVLKIVGDYAWESASQIRNPKFEIRNKFKIPNSKFKTLDEFYPFKKDDYSFKIRLFQKIQTWVAGRADKIITPSEYLKGIVKKWGIAENKINVVYNAANLLKIDVQKESGDFTIISVGRLVPWKGYSTLIGVFASLLKEYPYLKLKIIGSGPEMESLKRLVSELELEERVGLDGSVSHETALREMSSASLFVLNTAYEGLSHVLLEALAVGTPVITTTAGGNPEVIKDGWNGILIKYNDSDALRAAIIKMIGDKDFREMCVKNGLQSLEKFSEEEMINKTLQVLTIDP